MVRVPDLSGISDNPPTNIPLTQDKFDRGVISLIDQSKLPRNALKTADGYWLTEDGAPEISPGVAFYGMSASANAIDGGGFYVDSSDAIHLLKVAGGVVYRSLNNGTSWTACTAGAFTPGKKISMFQTNSYEYIFNGWDNIIRYDGTTVLQTYVSLSTPVGNVPTKTGLAATTYTYNYRVAATNAIGTTLASTAQTIQVSTTRDQFNTTNFVTFTWTAVAGAVRYDIYVGQIAGEESYIASVDGNATTTYIDNANAIEQISVTVPEGNTTQGPRIGDLEPVGVRLVGTRDRDFAWRVWISDAGRKIGNFAGDGAAYVDLQKGSQYKPVKVEDYKNKTNDPVITVWCKSVDGLGCIWQGTIESISVGDQVIPVPSFYKLPGSRGTDAPFSVVNVLNDYLYYNSQAFYNLGSRAQYLNMLSTDEASANIRPDVKSITQSAAPGIAAHFLDAKVYISVPQNSSTNNVTMLYDTERKAWMPRSILVGFERFFDYTDTSGNRHLMCWRTGDTQFSEISKSIKGNYGVASQTTLTTGLMHVNPKNRFDFLWIEEGEVEFAQSQGQINIELSAITRQNGFKRVARRRILPTSVSYSWTIGGWTKHKWTYVQGAPVSYSEPSLKRFFNVQNDVNAYQYSITTNTLEASLIVRTLQVNGTATQAGKPREWELLDIV